MLRNWRRKNKVQIFETLRAGNLDLYSPLVAYRINAHAGDFLGPAICASVTDRLGSKNVTRHSKN